MRPHATFLQTEHYAQPLLFKALFALPVGADYSIELNVSIGKSECDIPGIPPTQSDFGIPAVFTEGAPKRRIAHKADLPSHHTLRTAVSINGNIPIPRHPARAFTASSSRCHRELYNCRGAANDWRS
jgi:hypothetical protein